jgi:DNA-binding transcriptional MerR regulator
MENINFEKIEKRDQPFKEEIEINKIEDLSEDPDLRYLYKKKEAIEDSISEIKALLENPEIGPEEKDKYLKQLERLNEELQEVSKKIRSIGERKYSNKDELN